jgi:hypothetical protein
VTLFVIVVAQTAAAVVKGAAGSADRESGREAARPALVRCVRLGGHFPAKPLGNPSLHS